VQGISYSEVENEKCILHHRRAWLLLPKCLHDGLTLYGKGEILSRIIYLFIFVIPFYLQSVLVHSANCVARIQWHVEECSVGLLCN
jgi:hypothetical protein